MELIFPETWPVSLELTAAILGFIVFTVWGAAKAYGKIMAKVDGIIDKIEHMEQRNALADAETAKLKLEQGDQRVAQAVMSQKIHNQSESIARIDRGVQELLKAARRGP